MLTDSVLDSEFSKVLPAMPHEFLQRSATNTHTSVRMPATPVNVF